MLDIVAIVIAGELAAILVVLLRVVRIMIEWREYALDRPH